MVSIVISSMNPHEWQEFALEGHTLRLFTYLTIPMSQKLGEGYTAGYRSKGRPTMIKIKKGEQL